MSTSAVLSLQLPTSVPCDVDWLAFRMHYPNPDPNYTWNQMTGLPSACSAVMPAHHDEEDRASGSLLFLDKFFRKTARQSAEGRHTDMESGGRDSKHVESGSSQLPQQQQLKPGREWEREVAQNVISPPIDSFLMTKKFLLKVAGKENIIVLTIGNSAWKDFIFNWVISANRVGMYSYVVVAMDEPLLRTLHGRGIPVATSRLGFAGPDVAVWESQQFRDMQKIKPASIIDVLEAGYDVLAADPDQVWFRNPLPYFLSHPEPDILCSTDCPIALGDDSFLGSGGAQEVGRLDAVDPGPWPPCDAKLYHFNVGLMFVRRRDPSLQLLRDWASRLSTGDKQHWDQQVFNDMLKVTLPSATSKLVLPSGVYYRLYDGLLLIGALPQGLFANGLSFFYSGLPVPSPIAAADSSFAELASVGRAPPPAPPLAPGGLTSGLEPRPNPGLTSSQDSLTVSANDGTAADAAVGPDNNKDEAVSHPLPTPFMIHTNYEGSAHNKRMRLRDCALWDVDPPSYLFPLEKGFLRYEQVIPEQLLEESASDPEKNLSLRKLQLGWLRNALAIAFVLDRILIMPTLFGDWPWSWRFKNMVGKLAGDRARSWTDTVLNLEAMEQNGDEELIRGSGFLSSRWLGRDIWRSRLNVGVLEGEELASLSLPLTHSTRRLGHRRRSRYRRRSLGNRWRLRSLKEEVEGEKEGRVIEGEEVDNDHEGDDDYVNSTTRSRLFEAKPEVAGSNLYGEQSDFLMHCVNGSLFASDVVMEQATRIKITRGMTDVDVASCFRPLGYVKLLEFSTMADMFGGFVSLEERNIFVSRWGRYAQTFPDDEEGLFGSLVG
ncbi:hypothetical protein CBR_g41334 [Chara braunii]|uniref:Nucleotide-diphospho-sugar transferase domain-containing protein n=1 Tax=Chara braunii TaxID=69332 RepID=A0A388LVR9_CHABU|nr:hypothetical protein CBR_g41334 [Chara braunii]|eukprot:GBG86339.1 hypothetical protein CBR_g41334 [Chara braunii]